MLRSDICDYSEVYIFIKGTITVEGANYRDNHNKSFISKNNAPSIYCVSKSNGTSIDNAEIPRCCNAYVPFDWIQQNLFKDICYFMWLLQRCL